MPKLTFALVTLFVLVPFTGAVAQSDDPFDDWFAEEDEPSAKAGPLVDASTPDFKRACELQKSGKFRAAQKLFRQLLEKHPKSVHKAAVEARSDDNAILGCEMLHTSGPPERRIDISVMGDGFTIDEQDQALEEEWAKLCVTVLFSEFVYAEYRDYFNYYFVRLASLEEGVDPNLSEEERKKIEERNRSKTRKRKTDFSTALDCKAAGPQGQVLADRNLVYKFLKLASKDVPGAADDYLVIAFARFGVLGMGGGGIANVGRPDKSVTVHELGHAFVGLLDEYTINPGTPTRDIVAPNASTTSDRDKVPWAHFLEKGVDGVGVYEGGATYIKGVWRPSRNCAMNSAGNMHYCPVCREAAILRVYAYVDPIDAFDPPNTQEIEAAAGAQKFLMVAPMRPKTKPLDVGWYVEPVDGGATMPAPAQRTTEKRNRVRDAIEGRFTGGARATMKREDLDAPPPGVKSALGSTRKTKNGATEHVFGLGQLKPGRYRVTAVVADRTPHVLLDRKHLLEERKTWWVKVAAPAPATPK